MYVYHSLQRLLFLLKFKSILDGRDAKQRGRRKKKTLGNEATMGDDVTRCWRLIQIKFCLRQEVFVTLAKVF